MGTYRLNKSAREDLTDIYHYGLNEFGMAQADRYFHELFKRFEQIAQHPYLYPSVDYIRPGYRRSVFGKDSIYYRVDDDNVEIMRILGRQDINRAH